MNLYPYNTGHLMIAPYAHVPSIQEMNPDSLTEMMILAQRMLGALQDALGAQGFNLGINQGAVAGAGITDHAHLHIVPRWNGDTNFMPVLADVKVMPEFLVTTYHKIRERLSPLAPDQETPPAPPARRPRRRPQ